LRRLLSYRRLNERRGNPGAGRRRVDAVRSRAREESSVRILTGRDCQRRFCGVRVQIGGKLVVPRDLLLHNPTRTEQKTRRERAANQIAMTNQKVRGGRDVLARMVGPHEVARRSRFAGERGRSSRSRRFKPRGRGGRLLGLNDVGLAAGIPTASTSKTSSQTIFHREAPFLNASLLPVPILRASSAQ
jgi:hypothetical protein